MTIRCADLWNLSTLNAEETQSSFSLGFVDPQCGMFASRGFPPHHAMPDCRCRLDGVSGWLPTLGHSPARPRLPTRRYLPAFSLPNGGDDAAYETLMDLGHVPPRELRR